MSYFSISVSIIEALILRNSTEIQRAHQINVDHVHVTPATQSIEVRVTALVCTQSWQLFNSLLCEHSFKAENQEPLTN